MGGDKFPQGGRIVEIRNVTPADGGSYNLKGAMKVTNAPAEGDSFTQSEKAEEGFLHKVGEKIKGLFSGSREDKPAKEPGGWYRKPDGTTEWISQSTPPAPKDNHGHWVLDTACGAADWYWVKDNRPADGPEHTGQ